MNIPECMHDLISELKLDSIDVRWTLKKSDAYEAYYLVHSILGITIVLYCLLKIACRTSDFRKVKLISYVAKRGLAMADISALSDGNLRGYSRISLNGHSKKGTLY